MSESASASASASAVPDEAVAPLIRGVSVLLRLTEAGGRLSPSDLERATGLARSTVDRITTTLARMEYVRQDGRDVVLTPRVMELGNAYLGALRLPGLLSARADALADELDESVSLAVADRDGIRFIHQATRRRAMSLSFRIGDLLPAERTAPGPLFATEWTEADWRHWRERRTRDPRDTSFPAVPPRTRPAPEPDPEPDPTPAATPAPPPNSHPDPDDFATRTTRASADGWSLDDQLIEPGLVAVSVPVRDPENGRIACVASVVSHTSRRTAADLRSALLPRLRAAVAEMEETLRTAPPTLPAHSATGLAAWTSASKHELGRGFVESLARGLTVLTAFGEGRAAPTLTEVANATGLPRATARRALITYTHLGLVEARDRAFVLTPRTLSLGFPALSRLSLPQIATPHLADLSSRIQESSTLAVLTEDHEETQYTAGVPAPHVLSVRIAVGTRLPARATASGRVLLDPRDGYALVDGVLEEGLRSLAVPVRDRAGRVVAALGTALHAARRTPEQCVADLLPALWATASHISADLAAASRFTPTPLT
ncbi:IclR family transcriptional regulator [Streptomyces mangrovisoli]|uniref:IclR family transcriptional regulator n=1 Tax=Streptomyces mangrovisoli TaxID=1428628 RepID=A0A1J4P1L0_9ACTN|nr:IclR family transcriptional regulator [Streptomyces mangrovisoli]